MYLNDSDIVIYIQVKVSRKKTRQNQIGRKLWLSIFLWCNENVILYKSEKNMWTCVVLKMWLVQQQKVHCWCPFVSLFVSTTEFVHLLHNLFFEIRGIFVINNMKKTALYLVHFLEGIAKLQIQIVQKVHQTWPWPNW